MVHPLKVGLVVNTDELAQRDSARSLSEMLDRAVTARNMGFRAITVAQRYSVGPAHSSDEDRRPLHTWRFQPFLALAYLAAEFRDAVDYSTGVILSTGLHPVQLAEDVATLDAMCCGRLRLGVGLGWMPYEFEAFGVDMRRRRDRFEELITAYRALLTQDEVNLDGPNFPMQRAMMVARSQQRPAPPLWIGASADAAVLRAARLGDAWMMSGHIDLQTLAKQQALFNAERERLSLPRPKDIPVVRMLAIAEDRETALSQIRPLVEDWYRKRGEWGWFLTNRPDADVRRIGDRWIVGDPDDCLRQLQLIRETLGATEVTLAMAYPGVTPEARLNMIRLMGKHVIPNL